MLIHRKEADSEHVYFSSDTGLSDWICRQHFGHYEVQISSAYQNYTALVQLSAEDAIEIRPSLEEADYSETKKVPFPATSNSQVEHSLRGSFYLKVRTATKLKIDKVYLESTRGVRIVQEGGQDEYLSFSANLPAVKLLGVKTEKSAPSTVCTIVYERNFKAILQYLLKLEIRQESGTSELFESSDDRGTLSFIQLSAGSYRIDSSLSICGKLLDENYSCFSKNPLDILQPSLRSTIASLQNSNSLVQQIEALNALSRKEKFLAGGPRFFTYFGRDTLVSIALLSKFIVPELLLQGIRSVLRRLSPNGAVAHEETIGEHAIIQRWHKTSTIETKFGDRDLQPAPAELGEDFSIAQQCDYHMVDDDFLLSAVILRLIDCGYLREVADMLAEKFKVNENGYALLGKNIRYCFSQCKQGLVSFHKGIPVGDWRDSLADIGIEYSYEVNQGILPAFKSTITSLRKKLPQLDARLRKSMSKEELDKADLILKAQSASFFCSVDLEEELGEGRLDHRLASMGFSKKEREAIIESVPSAKGEYRFLALALNAHKQPIAIQHNDCAFSLLFDNPPEEILDTMLRPLETPFPIGLKTEVGILVSNPIFCPDSTIVRKLNRSHYHGLVIWPLMHNMLVSGLQRQLKRFSTAGQLHRRLKAIVAYLQEISPQIAEYSASELFTFSPIAIRKTNETQIQYKPQAFGQNVGSSTESNPIQLWSSLSFTMQKN